MPTLTHYCGFEEDGYTDGPFGSGAHGYNDSGTIVFDSSIKRNGRFSLKLNNGRLNKTFAATAHVVTSIWFRWTGSDAGGIIEQATNGAGIAISSAGVMSVSAGGNSYTNGATVTADAWHLLDYYWNGSANPRVVKWKIDGVAQTDKSYAAASTTETTLSLSGVGAVSAATVWLDDWCISVTPADYPIGPIAVEGFYPTGDGTHVNESYFYDETANPVTGSSTYLKVIPKNDGTWFEQRTVGATSYLEWTLPDTTRTNAILGVAVTAAVEAWSPFGSHPGAVKLYANGAEATVFSGAFPWGGFFGETTLFAQAPGPTAWTTALVNGAKIRFGYCSSSPEVVIESVVMEIAFDDDPPETGGGGGGDPGDPGVDPDAVPGIWVDWVGDGTGWTDETTRVMAMSWTRGASYDHVSGPGPGNATIIVQNDDHRFNPDYAAGPLYGQLLPARPVWGGANVDTGSLTTSAAADVRGFFGGYISEIVPLPVPGGNPTAEILCEDALGWYRRATATVGPTRDVTRGTFRQSVLTSIGEIAARRTLEAETERMPFASADTRDALSTLDELNRADSARHFIAPADFKERTYYYTLVNRLHKLVDAEDENWNGDDVQDISGYRVTVDNVDNLQRATVSPLSFGALNEIVWSASPLPIIVTVGVDITLWAEFADYVFDAAVQTNSTGGTLTTTLTNFGTSAKLVLSATGSVVNITALDVTGSSLRRGDLQTVRSEDAASQAAYGVRAGGDVSTDYIGQPGAAKAVTDYLIWKFAEPLKRPTVTRSGKDATTIASLLERDLFDVVTLTVDRLDMVARRFEIIGLSGTLIPKSAGSPFYQISYELQETPNQEPVDFFVIDVDSINGVKLIAPF